MGVIDIFDSQGFFEAVIMQNADKLRAYFEPHAIIRWEDSHEQLTTDGYVRATCEYPGDWQGKIKSITPLACDDADTVVVSNIYSSDGDNFYVISFFTFNADKSLISQLVEYYSAVNEPPEWRKDLSIRTK